MNGPVTGPLRVHQVSSLDMPEIAAYRTLRRPHDHRARRIFVAEGATVVERLLSSPLRLLSLLLTPEWLARLEQRLEQTRRGTDVYVAGRQLMQQIVGFHLHQGIMAVAEIPPDPPLSSLPPGHLLVALDDLQHAENVGTLVRNCAAFGADGLIAAGTGCSPYLRRAVRNSMGAVFTLPVVHSDNLAGTLDLLRTERGTRIVCADPWGDQTIDNVDFGGNICLVAGNEGAGVSASILELSGARVRIPMDRGTDSLNVATAIAVLLYEARRRRSGSPRR